MKREHISKVGRKPVQAEVIEGPTDQGVNGTATASKVDLREAIVGDYRFQGSLIRAFYVAGDTWFVGSEACEVLELINSRMMVKSLDPDQRGVSTIDTAGGAQEVNLISESALYVLIFKSRKPQAKAFRRWVANEVLPQIRRTGSYTASGQIGQDDRAIVLPFPTEPTRFVVVASPGQPAHVRRTSISEIVTEFTALDRQAMCYTLKQIEVWWNKVQIKESPSFSQDEGFAIHKLDAAIREGSEMADHFLHVPVRDGLTSQARDS